MVKPPVEKLGGFYTLLLHCYFLPHNLAWPYGITLAYDETNNRYETTTNLYQVVNTLLIDCRYTFFSYLERVKSSIILHSIGIPYESNSSFANE